MRACEVQPVILDPICSIIERKATTGDLRSCSDWSVFHASSIPSITIKEYITRFVKYANITDEQLVLSLVYFERLLEFNHDLLDSYSVHRCIITSLVLASKYTNDQPFNNNFYARIGGLPVVELNNLELTFLRFINFELYITTKTLQQYQARILSVHQSNVSQKLKQSPTKEYTNTSTTYFCMEKDTIAE